jgi:hypothetical protein
MDARRIVGLLESVIDGQPCCPRCGGRDGSIGTQGAYFTCSNYECKEFVGGQGHQVTVTMYWCCDKYGWHCRCTWQEKVTASPWGYQVVYTVKVST